MERKHKFEILLALGLIILLVIAIWWLLSPDPQEDAGSITGDDQVQDIQEYQEPLDLTGYEVSASTIARVFVERFASFSNHGDYENVGSVMDISTVALQDRLQDLIDDVSNDDGSIYYGVSTFILSISQIEVSETREVLEVLTQREESIESPSDSTVRYQTMEVTLVKQGDEWFVDDFEWVD